jgi:tRNA threonylcarbamoyladenosine biosynthesis protein TsaB
VTDQLFNLAIESSTRSAAVALGVVDGSAPLAVGPGDLANLPDTQRSSELMAMIEQLCEEHGAAPKQIGEIYISVGPGSFTGLRIGISTVKAIAQVTGAKVVAVPTLDVVAQNTPEEIERVAVCLNQKRDTVYAGIFAKAEPLEDGDVDALQSSGSLCSHWQAAQPAGLVTLESLAASASATSERPLALLGDPLLPVPEALEGLTILPVELATPRVEAVWQIGAAMAAAGRFTDPMELVPSYIRPPEAVELWAKRKAMKK